MIHTHPCWVYILEKNLEYLKLFSLFCSLLICITNIPTVCFGSEEEGILQLYVNALDGVQLQE